MNVEKADPPLKPFWSEGFSAEHWRSIFDAIPGINLLLAADAPRFTMLLANDERLAATMTTREATIGLPLFEVFPDANPENSEGSGVGNLRSSLETVLRTGTPHRMAPQRYDLRRSDGSWEKRYWSPLNSPVLDPDGKVLFLVHQVTDITKAVQDQQALAQSELRAARILDRMADMHCVLDAKLQVVTLNSAAERLTGRMRASVIGLPHWEAFPESYSANMNEAYQRVAAEGIEQHLILNYEKSGQSVHLEIDAYPTDEGGVAIFARDISERVRISEASRKIQTHRFRTQLGDALSGLSDENAVRAEAIRLLADHLASSWAAYGEGPDSTSENYVIHAEHVREAQHDVVGSLIFSKLGASLTEAMLAKRNLILMDSRDLIGLSKSSAEQLEAMGIRACVIAPLLRETSGRAFIAVTQSVPRAWTEAEISLIEETAERTCVALVRSRAEVALRDSDRRKDEFLATLAHELRNPLAPVRHGVQILRLSSQDAEKTSQTLGMMERQLTHITRLIDDLLDVSRITRGAVTLKKERLVLRTVLDSAIESVRHLVEGGRHALTLHVPYEPLYLEADATRLSQVLGNLIHNAAKYTPEGGQIDLFAERIKSEVVIRVQDTGVGIPASMLSRVFDLFAQVGGSSLERSHGGLGIGLSISKQLVDMHDGSIRAESPGPGFGSTFTIQLPLAPDDQGEKHDIPVIDRQLSGSAKRILVVDDNVVAADTFTSMLELFGYSVNTVYSGMDAIEAAKTLCPTHIFCDIGMPGMNGYEVARRLRADESQAATRLVAVTGWGSEDDKRRALEAGFDFHLAKPVEWVSVEELLINQ